MKKVVLIDMDGTLTAAREKIGRDALLSLEKLCGVIDVAIVSGSDYDYIYEQCIKDILKEGFERNITIMPCNGTKVYKFDSNKGDFTKVFDVSMESHLGTEDFNSLKGYIEISQRLIAYDYDIEVKGDFISDRESMINWCPIGRDVTPEERKEFVSSLHLSIFMRDLAIVVIRSMLPEELGRKLEFVLGGETSIDIYPKGWDKTFSLSHYPECEAWFIGDKCNLGGNDYHLYEALRTEGSERKRSFKTVGPSNTIRIMDSIRGTVFSDTQLSRSMIYDEVIGEYVILTPPPIIGFTELEEEFFDSKPKWRYRDFIDRIVDFIWGAE